MPAIYTTQGQSNLVYAQNYLIWEAASESQAPRILAPGGGISINPMFYARLKFLLEAFGFISELPLETMMNYRCHAGFPFPGAFYFI